MNSSIKYTSRLVETIKIEDGKICNLEYHNARASKSRRELFGEIAPLDIEGALLKQHIPQKGIYKCRVLYRRDIEEIQIDPYDVPTIHSLCALQDDDIEYAHKWERRDKLDALRERKGNCDDVLIVKRGFVTDTSFSNIALYDGTKWVTPSTYLLRGTKREKLLCEGILHEKEVRIEDLHLYTQIALINAMIELGDVVVAIENVVWKHS
ncbi:MAG: aminotransferase class IV [Spirochaetes bacterium]|nr:aminotransferase class IV [Spirochaetota bacterium]